MRTILLTALFATACAADPADDAPPDDGPVTIVGTWRWLPNVFDGEVPVDGRFVLALRADETFRVTGPTLDGDGTYLFYGTNPQRLRLLWSDGAFEEMDVVLREDRLLLSALYPDGRVDGPVGDWRGSTTYDGEIDYASYTIRADGSFRRFDGVVLIEGTWREVDQALELTIPGRDPYALDRLDEAGLGTLTERIADD